MIPTKHDFALKIVITGDSGVGKTCLLFRYVRDCFMSEHPSTLAVQFSTKVVKTDRHVIQLQLWDTAGQEVFRCVTRGYYRDSAGAFVVFDLTNRRSFQHVELWLSDLRNTARPDVVTVLLGNKSDLADRRDVTREQAEELARRNQIPYFETSAKTGDQIAEAVAACVGRIEAFVEQGVYDMIIRPSEPLTGETTKEKSCSC
jgi:small GTP-binding protein